MALGEEILAVARNFRGQLAALPVAGETAFKDNVDPRILQGTHCTVLSTIYAFKGASYPDGEIKQALQVKAAPGRWSSGTLGICRWRG